MAQRGVGILSTTETSARVAPVAVLVPAYEGRHRSALNGEQKGFRFHWWMPRTLATERGCKAVGFREQEKSPREPLP